VARDRRRARERKGREDQVPTGEPGFEPGEDVVPDSLEHAASEVDLAEAAMAVPPAADLSPDELVHPDELDSADAASDVKARQRRARERRAHAEGCDAGGFQLSHVEERPGLAARFAHFLRMSWAELQRVQWPDRAQVGQATAVVLAFVVITGAYLGGMDALFSRLIDAII
jgi:preprotein translocase SecE subunit